MAGWVRVLTAAFGVVSAVLRRIAELRKARRDAALRARAAADGAGVLLDQLKPRHDGGQADAAGAEKSATSDARRDSGTVDEQ